MQNIDTLILKLLRAAKRNKSNPTNKVSTYRIAKDIKISWSTANIHIYKLKSEGKIDGKMMCAEVGQAKKMVWWIPC